MKVKKKLLENYLEARLAKSYDIRRHNEIAAAIDNTCVMSVLCIATAIDIGITEVDAIAETLGTLCIEVIE